MIESGRQTTRLGQHSRMGDFRVEYGIGEEQSMTDEDREMISRFTGENFPDGYTMSVDWESFKEFDTNPALREGVQDLQGHFHNGIIVKNHSNNGNTC